MANTNDILLDDNYDMIIENGDIKIGDASEQHQQLLLLCNKGEFKQNPLVGVGLSRFILDEADYTDVQKEIVKQFENDGMQIDSLVQLNVVAHYK